ncbi:MAG: glycosyltransferase family 2 protein [Spirochaetia bacterium]|nr:glycosyltransferase family 2 protein [Spirochaetia bacterium]
MTSKENYHKVSILLSIYKVEDYLEECLDSLLNQSYHNLEIVCVDNGSPDNCGKILQKYAKKDSRIKIVTLKENRMLCGGRNAGLDHATGDFVCFVDPDDWVEKDHIKAMVDAILTKKDSLGNPYNLVLNRNAVSFMILADGSLKKMYDFGETSGEKTLNDVNLNVREDTEVPMWGRLYRKSFLDAHPDIRFLEGMNTDNIPYTFKLLAHMKRFYVIKGEENATYWRRLITPEGAITPVVLWKNMEIPICFDNLFDYLKKHHLAKNLRIPYHWFFTICFPRHKDQPRYYLRFKELMKKMEDTVKSSDVYKQEDRNLCDLLLYAPDFFNFMERYFTPVPVRISRSRIKLFGFIPFWYIRHKERKVYYDLFKIPLFKRVKTDDKEILYLFHFLPIWTRQTDRQ